ncbi:FkbM family methyltransferase [bacterium]|nr:FkbM family methyltransferase [bacterium]
MQASWKNLKISYQQEEEYRDLKREILDGGIYYFETDQDRPIIIDAGAHIGLSSLYFKWLYPYCQILAFEPNPRLFALLSENISQNELTDVTLVPAALGKHAGTADFWLDATAWQWWSVGSFIPGAWNGEQKAQEKITVQTVKLIDYVKKLPRVDLLKMDIEGAEWTVLRGLREQIDKIQELIFEFHPTKNQNLSELMAYLQKRGLAVSLADRKGRRVTSWHEGELILVTAKRR